MSKQIKNIVIVGGGTAGWITAGTLAASLIKKVAGGYSITLVESASIPIIGVGEGTWPTMRNTLKNMGIKETDFIRRCHVSFKQGAKFSQWVTGKSDDFYYHPLVLPQGFDQINLTPHWQSLANQQSFSKTVCPQEAICELGLAPKLITTPEYQAQANYAYHLDAGTFSEFLKEHCTTTLNIQHIVDDVVQINSSKTGDIASVTTASNGDISGDLFIDCTGFKSLLLGEHYKVPFVSCEDVLFTNQAIAVQVPYEHEDSPIQSHTLSTAQSAGWVWDIGLTTRRGVGYVYSNNYTSEDLAHQELLNYLSSTVREPEKLSFRNIPIKSGYRERFWEKNCVAIGLSSGFLEPLESTSIFLIQIAITKLIEFFPNKDFHQAAITQYNQTMSHHYIQIRNFIILHYHATQRNDSDFWHYCREMSIPDELQHLLSLFKEGGRVDRTQFGIWPAVCIGQGVIPEQYDARIDNLPYDKIQQYMNNYRMQVQHAVNTLPSIDNYLRQVMKSI